MTTPCPCVRCRCHGTIGKRHPAGVDAVHQRDAEHTPCAGTDQRRAGPDSRSAGAKKGLAQDHSPHHRAQPRRIDQGDRPQGAHRAGQPAGARPVPHRGAFAEGRRRQDHHHRRSWCHHGGDAGRPGRRGRRQSRLRHAGPTWARRDRLHGARPVARRRHRSVLRHASAHVAGLEPVGDPGIRA